MERSQKPLLGRWLQVKIPNLFFQPQPGGSAVCVLTDVGGDICPPYTSFGGHLYVKASEGRCSWGTEASPF